MISPDLFNEKGRPYLPGHLGIRVTKVEDAQVTAELTVAKQLIAPNGFLHAGSVVTLADTCAGYGATANLPENAAGFTTIELKSNFLGTAREGVVTCTATGVHMGRQTQIWDAKVIHKDTGKTIALFRCTQFILYP